MILAENADMEYNRKKAQFFNRNARTLLYSKPSSAIRISEPLTRSVFTYQALFIFMYASCRCRVMYCCIGVSLFPTATVLFYHSAFLLLEPAY